MKNNIIEEALADMKKIKEEAEKLAKEKLAGSMSELYENMVSEELKKKTKKDSINEEKEEDDMQDDLTSQTIKEEESEEFSDEELEMDLTEASMEEIEKIFSQSSDDTDVEVVSDEPEMNSELGGEEELDLGEYDTNREGMDYDDEQGEVPGEQDTGPDEYSEGMYEEEETDDEVNLDDFELDDIDLDEMEGADEPPSDDSMVTEKEEEVDETSGHGQSYDKRRAVGNAYQQHLKYAKERMRPAVQDTISEKYNVLLNKNKELIKKLNESMNTQKKLYSANKQLNEAIKDIKNQLYDLSVFNTNLSHVNKLFVEHSTTLDEKKMIVKNFKNAKTIEESKNTFQKLTEQLSSKKPIEESVKEKSVKVLDSSTKTNIVETTAYDVNDNQHLKRIKDVINKMNKKK